MNLESYFPGTNLGLRSFTGARKAGRGGGGAGFHSRGHCFTTHLVRTFVRLEKPRINISEVLYKNLYYPMQGVVIVQCRVNHYLSL